MIMSDIRFRINTENVDLRKLIEQMGFDDRTELTFKNFDEFIRVVNPSITTEEVVYFFEKLDVNDDGKVSIKELELEMQRNHIMLDPTDKDQKTPLHEFSSTSTLPSEPSLIENPCSLFSQSPHHKKPRITEDLEYKIRKSFIKLYKILNDKKLTLYKTFKSYD